METPSISPKKIIGTPGVDGPERPGQSTEGSDASAFWTALSVFFAVLAVALILARIAGPMLHPAINDATVAQTAALEPPPLHVHVEGVDP